MNPITFLVQHIILPLLQFLYDNIYANYAVAIILLTVMVKVVFFPLTQKQFSSMKKMSALQPELKVLQDKYKSDPKRMQQEMMALYKRHQVNPLSGCLPLLVQMPVLIALFYALTHQQFISLVRTEGVHASFFWIMDLSRKDPWYVLPVFIGLLTWLPQKLGVSGPAPEGSQKMIMMYMPVFMLFISINLPAGVCLYLAVSQLLSTVQQYLAMRPQAASMLQPSGRA